MFYGILLSGTSAAAITAALAPSPLTWSDLTTTTFGNSTGIPTFTMFSVFHPATRVLPFTHVRVTLENSTGSVTVTKAYIGEVVATRTGYAFQTSPTQITFDGGSTSVTLPATTSKLSDEIELAFSGAYQLGIAFICSSVTGSQPRVISSFAAWNTYNGVGDLFPDPATATMTQDTLNAVWMIKDIDVVYGHFVPVDRITTSRHAVHAVKEGALPSNNRIRTVTHAFYVVKG